MIKYVYLAWQDQNSRWHIIGQLRRTSAGYEFRYTEGIKKVNSIPMQLNMPENDKVYRSNELFSLFKNRLMPKSRPEYADYLKWLGIKATEPFDELEALAISGGERETDFFRIVPVPEKNPKGEYSFKFFVNGLSHMSEAAQKRALDLDKDEILYMAHDFQNKEDKSALLLRTEHPPYEIGYIPAYFTKLIHDISKETPIQVRVLQVNKDAPIQMRLLCEISSSLLNRSWENYEDEFKLISSE